MQHYLASQHTAMTLRVNLFRFNFHTTQEILLLDPNSYFGRLFKFHILVSFLGVIYRLSKR